MTAEHRGILATISVAAEQGDSIARNKAVVYAASQGVPRAAIAAAAGLNKVGNIIRAARREGVSA